MRILVTGGTGYIGSRLTDLLKKQHDVSTLGIEKGVDIKADITDFDAIKNSVKGYDAVCHLAALIGTRESIERPMDFFQVNSLGTLNILEAARRNGIKKLVLSSSVIVYGEPEFLPMGETHPVRPNNPYGYSKWVAEEFCRSYSESYGINTVIARIGHLYGPGQTNLFFPTLISQANKDRIVLRNLDFKLDYIFIDDVVAALAKCVAYGRSDTFNIGSGKSYSGGQIVDTLSKILNKKLNVEVTKPVKEGETLLDISKAKKLLGWEPKISLEEGLKKMLASISP